MSDTVITNPTRKQLPPDPDRLNEDRSSWAGAAITTFIHVTGTDEEDAVADLLADLIHYCDRKGTDFETALDRARGHYEAETAGEEAA